MLMIQRLAVESEERSFVEVAGMVGFNLAEGTLGLRWRLAEGFAWEAVWGKERRYVGSSGREEKWAFQFRYAEVCLARIKS